MAGKYSVTKGHIVKASVLQSTGVAPTKGDKKDFVENIKQGIKNVMRPYPNHLEPYSGTLLALEFKVGVTPLYYDVYIDEPEFADIIANFGADFTFTDKALVRESDIHIQAWDCYVAADKDVFIRIKSETKDGKTYHNVTKFGPTKQSVEFEQKLPEGFRPANPFANVQSKVTERKACPVASAPVAMPEPTAASGLPGAGTTEEIPF